MSYDILKNPDGEILIYPLELPMYEGNTAELCQQASVSLISCLRHFAVADAYIEEGFAGEDLVQYGDTRDMLDQHMEQGATQLVSTMMALTSLAHAYGIDIMQEIYDAELM